MTLTEHDKHQVATYKARMKELAEKMTPLKMYTRPLGKSTQPYPIAAALERRYNDYATEYAILQTKVRDIYRANGMELL